MSSKETSPKVKISRMSKREAMLMTPRTFEPYWLAAVEHLLRMEERRLGQELNRAAREEARQMKATRRIKRPRDTKAI